MIHTDLLKLSRRYSLLLILLFITLRLSAQQKDIVCNLDNVPEGWGVIDIRYDYNKCCNLSTKCTLYEIINLKDFDVMEVCNINHMPTGWELVNQYNCLGDCCGGSKVKYTIRRKFASTSGSGDDGYIADEDRPKFIPYTPNTPAQIAAHNAKVSKAKGNASLAGQTSIGSILPILTCEDVKSVDIFIQPLSSSSKSYLGEYLLCDNYNKFIEQKINYCDKPIWTKEYDKIYNKKSQLPIGKYKIIAIEKTDNPLVRKCEKTVEVFANTCIAIDINFDYGYLYLTLQTRIDYKKVKLDLNGKTRNCLEIIPNHLYIDVMVQKEVGGGLWKWYFLNTIQKNSSLCNNSTEDPLVLKPGTYKSRTKITVIKDGVEEKIIGDHEITITPNGCLTFDSYIDKLFLEL